MLNVCRRRFCTEAFIPRTGRKLQRDYHDIIKTLKTQSELLAFASESREPLDPINRVTILSKLAKLRELESIQPNHHPLIIPQSLKPESLDNWEPRTIAYLLWSAGKLKDVSLVERFVIPAIGDLDKWSNVDLILSAWGLVSCSAAGASEFVSLVEEVILKDAERVLEPKHLAMFLWCQATLGNHIIDFFVNQCMELLPKFQPHDLGVTVWSFGKTNTMNDRFFADVVSRVHELLASHGEQLAVSTAVPTGSKKSRPSKGHTQPLLNAVVVANLVFGFSHCYRKKSATLFQLLRPHIEALTLSPEQFSSIALAYSKEGILPPASLKKRRWDAYGLREMLNVVWALSRSPENELYISAIVCLVRQLKRDRSKISHDDIYALTRALALSSSTLKVYMFVVFDQAQITLKPS